MTLNEPSLRSPLGHETALKRAPPIAEAGAKPGEPAYYEIPFLKKPVWTWEIGTYFFLGGLSAGSYVLARLAERVGGDRYRSLTRAGTYVALGAVLPCPVLLIADLGDPTRFHHMLRVFKPRSPMSLGSWTLAGYSGMVFLAARREWLIPHPRRPGLVARAGMLLLDAVGIPMALFFSGYTGVLLSGTATPIWSQNPWLGPLFCASAIANGAAALQLATKAYETSEPSAAANGGAAVKGGAAAKPLEMIGTAVHVAEGALLAGAVRTAGAAIKPLMSGQAAPFFWTAVASLAAAEVLRRIPAQGRAKSLTRNVSAAIELAGGFCLKWAIFRSGSDSAADPRANRNSSRHR